MNQTEEKRFKYQILVAEDEPELADILNATLHGKGNRVIVCNSVSLIQQKLSNQKFDVLVFDINLIDGTIERLVEHLRTEEYSNLNRFTPIIIISGFLDAHTVSKIRPHIQGALVKPFSMEDLWKRIEQVATQKVN